MPKRARLNGTTSTIPDSDPDDDSNDDSHDHSHVESQVDNGDAETEADGPASDEMLEGSVAGDPDPGTALVAQEQSTIDFDDVYLNGNAELKDFIILYENEWYIFRCDVCGMHFNHNPIMGAGRHLDSKRHNNQSRCGSVAVK
ncbi:hypothetical protein IMZ48_17570, partial [Candidatus Bathyarchaeota archaeon]|nr:hypothetical protein [Candidatus Bathyarchaeota archaeon]